MIVINGCMIFNNVSTTVANIIAIALNVITIVVIVIALIVIIVVVGKEIVKVKSMTRSKR